MHVAVIGGTRHVGLSVVRLLVESGHQVEVYNRGKTRANLPAGVERVTVDRHVPSQLEAALATRQPEAVIDMIAFTVADVRQVTDTLPALRHYVFCGSTAVYGRIGKTAPDETETYASGGPDYPYATHKAECDRYLLNLFQDTGYPVTILRLAHPYGPGDHLLYTTGREALFLDRMRKGRTIVIPGDGQARIHPIYVEDAARAFLHVLDRPGCIGRVFNLAGDEVLTLDEYFASLARVLGVPLVARKLPGSFFRDHADLWKGQARKFDFGATWIDYESAFNIKALKATGFVNQTDHDRGAALTLQWLDANDLIPVSSDEDGEDLILEQSIARDTACLT